MAATSGILPLRIRPIAAMVAAYTGGILCAPLLPFPPSLCYLLAALTLLTTAVASKIPASGRVALLLLPFFLLGVGRTRAVSLPAADDVSHFVGSPSLWIRGKVASLVDVNSSGGYAFTLAAEEVNDYRNRQPVSGRVRVLLRKGAMPAIGATLQLRGRIEAIDGATNPGAFDYNAYSARHGIFCHLIVRYPEDCQTFDARPQLSLLTVAQAIRQWILGQTAIYLLKDDAGLLNGLLLSVRTQFPATLDDAFQRTGTVHILSVSGLHMTAFAGVLIFLFRYFLLPRPVANLSAIVLLWLFAIAAGGSAAPVRSAVMATVWLAAPLLRRTAEPLHSLGFSALILLFADPGSLYDAGFQLSFASVGGLLLFVGPLSAVLLPQAHSDTRLTRFSQHVLLALLVGVVAELVTAPLVAYHFNQWSFISPVANVMIALWSEWLLLAGLAIVLTAPLFALVSVPFAKLLYLPLAGGLWLMRFMAFSFAALPFAAIAVPSPPLPVLILYYILLGGAAIYVRRRFAKGGTVPNPDTVVAPAVLPIGSPTSATTNHLS